MMEMNTNHIYIAADFGGGSGRIIAGRLHQGRLSLEEIHRFPNRQIRLGKHLYWDFLALFEEMKLGIRKAVQRGYKIKSLGIDTWGVDFGLIDQEGNLVGNPVCYRDERTNGMPEKVFEKIDPKGYYATTGTQPMAINTIFQLYSLAEKRDEQLAVGKQLLFMPDLLSYFLTGVANNEYTIASTSGLLDARQRAWAWGFIDQLGLPKRLFGELVLPGTVRGRLTAAVAEELGTEAFPVIAVGSHDTGSAIAALPSTQGGTAFLSSGTWSLLGVETDCPILTDKAHKANFTNEGGVGGTIRFLQNINGLWILQQLMKEWKERGEEQTYDTLLQMAAETETEAYIDVDDPLFIHPISMEEAVRKGVFTKVAPPQSKAELTKCVLQSLALKYKEAVDKMNSCLHKPVTQLHIIGGGSQNGLLNQLTADFLQLPVHAGPVEATAIGNILMQALAQGELGNLMELRQVVIQSVTPQIYYPQ